MKYYLLAAAVGLMGAVAVYVSDQPEQAAKPEVSAWKYSAVENETAGRPDSFQAMKAEMGEPERLPASKKK